MESTTAAPTPTTEQRLDALELFLQHLLLVIECEPNFTAAHMDRWMEISRQHMRNTGSVAPATETALARLQQRVLA